MNEEYFYGRVSEEDREKLAYLPTICELLEMANREYHDWPAIGDDNAKYTYGELYSRVAKRRFYLNSLGISKGGKVAVMSRNSLDSMELFLAITSAGYTMIMLPAQLDEQKLAGCVMKFKSQIMDESAVGRAIRRIAHEIIEKNNGCEDLCLIGVRRRGVPLAKLIAQSICAVEGSEVLVGSLDITLYRDDVSEKSADPELHGTDIKFDVKGKRVVLVDDVLFTGRTTRAAIEAVMSLGRPASIQLAVLVDRGHRELPIRGDYIGKNVPTSKQELVSVCLPEYDGKTCVELYELD